MTASAERAVPTFGEIEKANLAADPLYDEPLRQDTSKVSISCSHAPGAHRILITGGAGFLGRATSAQLLRAGALVTCLDIQGFSYGNRLSFIKGDVRDPEAVRRAVLLTEPCIVIHAAAISFIPYCVAHENETWEVNVGGTEVILEAIQPDVRIIFVSSAAVYAPSISPHSETDQLDPIDIYGQSKLHSERMVAARGNATIIRPFNIYGPGDPTPHVIPAVINQALVGNQVTVGNTDTRRDFVHVDDAAECFVHLVYTAGLWGGDVTTFNLGTGRAYRISEAIDCVAKILRRALKTSVSPELLRNTDRPCLLADTKRLQALIPWTPRSLYAGLRDTIRCWQ